MKAWGMSMADLASHIKEYGDCSIVGSPMRRYKVQQGNAGARGIEWNFTFVSWWKIWLESGKWDKVGTRKGCYVMARYGDMKTPYSPTDVYICTVSQNSKDSFIVHPQSARIAVRQEKKARAAISSFM